MATNFDKALYQAPVGLDALDEAPEIEIEVVNPEEMTIEMDGLEISLTPEEETDEDFDANLAEYIDESELESIASTLISDVDEDVASRKDWLQTYVDGLELLGLKIEDRAEPWEGACGVYHPIMAEALVKFQADAMMSTFPAAGPVKTEIIGRETPEKKDSAIRVAADMNYRLTVKNNEYRTEHERMLWGLGLAGNAFKKIYYDPHFERETAIFVPAEDLIVPYGASNLQTAERVTHVMRKNKNDVRRLQVAGFWRDIDLGEPDNVLDEVEKKIAEKLGFRATTDDRFKILEVNVDLDLKGYEHKDDDGEPTRIALPYVVTIEKGSQKVLAIRRNWRPEDPTYKRRQHFVHYPYIPGFGFYAFGLIHMIGAFAKSGTSLLRQLVDAGSLANLPGGFKTRGLRVKGDDTPIAPGEFRDVDVPSGSIKDNLLPLPYKEPSQTLYQLLNQIIEDGRRFANTADLQVTDMSSQAPVGTTLAILERTLKVMSAVQARIHFALKEELGLLKEIIRDYTPEDYDYLPVEGEPTAKKSDYDNVNVIPVSDPNASTMAQKIVQYQSALQLAQMAPQLYNLPLLHRQMLDVLGLKDAQKLVPMPEDQKPVDPVSENQNMLINKPVKAFPMQDHQAHIAVHRALIQDPVVQQMLQNDPTVQQKAAAIQAHINEHLGFEYRRLIQERLGFALPPQMDENGEEISMDPALEAQLAPLMAQAAQQVLQQNQAQVAQQQAQQAAQDPVVQLQQAELQLKQQELQLKAQRDQAEIALKQRQQDMEMQRTMAQIQAQKEKDQAMMLKETIIHDKESEHDKEIVTKKIVADALKNVYNASVKGK